jgi:hypothetical protein
LPRGWPTAASQNTAKNFMLEAMRTQFYKIFGPQHEEAKKSGSILKKDKYDEIVDALRKYKTMKKDQFMKN